MGGSTVWDICLRRNLTNSKTFDFTGMLALSDKVYLSLGEPVVRLWKPDAEGRFSVKSFYNVLADNSGVFVDWRLFWDPSIPPRISVFCWIDKRGNFNY